MHLPKHGQAEVIRDVVGLRKRRDVSAKVLERLKSFTFERKPRSEASLRPNIGKGGLPLTDAHPDQTPNPDTEPAK